MSHFSSSKRERSLSIIWPETFMFRAEYIITALHYHYCASAVYGFLEGLGRYALLYCTTFRGLSGKNDGFLPSQRTRDDLAFQVKWAEHTETKEEKRGERGYREFSSEGQSRKDKGKEGHRQTAMAQYVPPFLPNSFSMSLLSSLSLPHYSRKKDRSG